MFITMKKLVKASSTAANAAETKSKDNSEAAGELGFRGNFKDWAIIASAAGAGHAVSMGLTSLISYAVDRGTESAAAAVGGGVSAGGAFGF